jgi:surface antigen
MMKKWVAWVAVTITASGLMVAGCTPENNVPGATVAGAVAGGLVGGLIFKGPAGVIGGALLGGIIGNAIGNQMDQQDRMRMEAAIVEIPVDETTTWTNVRTGVTYRVTPMREYYYLGDYCREYTSRVNVNGRWETAYGRACQMPDGTWKITS